MKRFGELSLFICLLLLILGGMTSFFWTPYSQEWVELSSEYEGLSLAHWFGQGENGVDVLSHCMLGIRNSLSLALIVTLCCAALGSFLGLVAAYSGGLVDSLLARIMDFFNAFPRLVLFMLVLAIAGRGMLPLAVALLLSGWSSFARSLRSQALSTLSEPFVEAARAQGCTSLRLLCVHVWPQLWPTVLVQIVSGVRGVIVAESALSFLGLGLKAETASLGRLLAQGREALLFAPHLLVIPGVLLFLLLLSVMLVGDKLQRLWTSA